MMHVHEVSNIIFNHWSVLTPSENWFLFVHLHYRASKSLFSERCNTNSFTYHKNLLNILDLNEPYLFWEDSSSGKNLRFSPASLVDII